MPSGDIETYYTKDSGTWRNRVEGGSDLPEEHERKEDAVTVGRRQAMGRQVEHIIHNQDGSIGERNSYGSDPRDVAG